MGVLVRNLKTQVEGRFQRGRRWPWFEPHLPEPYFESEHFGTAARPLLPAINEKPLSRSHTRAGRQASRPLAVHVGLGAIAASYLNQPNNHRPKHGVDTTPLANSPRRSGVLAHSDRKGRRLCNGRVDGRCSLTVDGRGIGSPGRSVQVERFVSRFRFSEMELPHSLWHPKVALPGQHEHGARRTTTLDERLKQ